MHLRGFPVFVAVVVALSAASPSLRAQSLDQIGFEVTAAQPADFRSQADRVRASMQTGGRYADAVPAERARVEALLARIQALFDERGSGTALSEADRIVVINAQNEVNAVLAHKYDQRVVCEYVNQTGSHRRSKQCVTAQQREARRRADQEALRERERSLWP